MRVYELKDKFRYLIKQDSEKKKILRELSACVVEKFNGFNTVRAEFDKKLRRPFRPVDILHGPVKKPDQLVNCFLSAKLNPTFTASCSDGPKSNKVKHSAAWQCYFCLNYYAPKERYDRHIKNCAGCSCCVYNFNTQRLLTFEEKLKFKGDIPLPPVAYIDFETTAPTDTCLNPENRNVYIVSYVIVFAFHPDLTQINRVIIERSFGHSLQKINELSYLAHQQLATEKNYRS